MKIKVVHCRKEKCHVYIGRPSKYGNKHPIGWCDVCNKSHDRTEAISECRKDILANPELVVSLIKELKKVDGDTVGCYCAPLPCHGNIYQELAEAYI